MMLRRMSLIIATVSILAQSPLARAQVTYQVDSWPPPSGSYEIFNNSQGSETEDCWVANSFQVTAGGQHITSLSFLPGASLTGLNITATLYTGTSLTSPAGLVRIPSTTTTTTINTTAGTLSTINLANPVDLTIGQIFYAALLIRSNPGNVFPYASDHDTGGGMSPPPLGRSFFDVGPTQSAPYDLDNTANATVLGASHPVVTFAQSPGNLVLRVNATPVPEPSSLALCGIGLVAGIRRWRRRRV